MPDLDIGPMPKGMTLAWTIFQEIAGARRFAEGVPMRIPPSEIAAWFALRGIRPTSRLLWFITQLDTAWLRAMRKQD